MELPVHPNRQLHPQSDHFQGSFRAAQPMNLTGHHFYIRLGTQRMEACRLCKDRALTGIQDMAKSAESALQIT